MSVFSEIADAAIGVGKQLGIFSHRKRPGIERILRYSEEWQICEPQVSLRPWRQVQLHKLPPLYMWILCLR